MEGSFEGISSTLSFLVPALAAAANVAATLILLSASRDRRKGRNLAYFTAAVSAWNVSIAAKVDSQFVFDHPDLASLLNFPVLIVPALAVRAASILLEYEQRSDRLRTRWFTFASVSLCVLQQWHLIFDGFHYRSSGAVAAAGPAFPLLALVGSAALFTILGMILGRASHDTPHQLAQRARICRAIVFVFIPLSAANYAASLGLPVIPLSSIFSLIVVALFVRAHLRQDFLWFDRAPVRIASVGSTLFALGGLALACDGTNLGYLLLGASAFPFARLWLEHQRTDSPGPRPRGTGGLGHRPWPQSMNGQSGAILSEAAEPDWSCYASCAPCSNQLRGYPSLPPFAFYLVDGATGRHRFHCSLGLPNPSVARRFPTVLPEEVSLFEFIVLPVSHRGRLIGSLARYAEANTRANSHQVPTWMRMVARDLAQTCCVNPSVSRIAATAERRVSDRQQEDPALPDLVIHEGIAGMVGSSEPFRACIDSIEKAAIHDLPVLVLGETGTGKELVARAIHARSPRSSGPCIVVNCPAIPDEVAEAELFGCVRGAYTGADSTRAGLFEAAHGGTIFLDEVGDLSLRIQAKLLRVLETHEVQRLGSTTSRKIDFRVVAATNQRLAQAVSEGRFRSDLFYRLAGVQIVTPSLRQRGAGDIAQLALHFAKRFCEAHRREFEGFDKDALSAILRHRWPGNVRELEASIYRALAISGARRITLQDLNFSSEIESEREILSESSVSPSVEPQRPCSPTSLRSEIWHQKRTILQEALLLSGGNQAAAARALGISRSNLSRMIKRYGVENIARRRTIGPKK